MSLGWPALPYEAWNATCDTLHAHTQVLGKLATALAPPEPQLQHTALRLTARGWETLPLPAPDGSGALVVALDLHAYEAIVEHSDGRAQRVALTPDRPVGAVMREVPTRSLLRLRPSSAGGTCDRDALTGGCTLGRNARRVHPRLGRHPRGPGSLRGRARLCPLSGPARVCGLRLGPRAVRERRRNPAAGRLSGLEADAIASRAWHRRTVAKRKRTRAKRS